MIRKTATAIRNYFNQQAAIRRLEQFSDSELRDIGLQREDIKLAVSGLLINPAPHSPRITARPPAALDTRSEITVTGSDRASPVTPKHQDRQSCKLGTEE